MSFAFVCEELNEDGNPCSARFDDPKMFRGHKNIVHERRYELICDKLIKNEPCNRILERGSDYPRHVSQMHSPKTCGLCEGLEFEDAYTFKEHYLAKHQTWFTCRQHHCRRHFKSQAELEKHVCLPIQHNIRCTFHYSEPCDAKLSTRRNLKRHFKQCHGISAQEELEAYMGHKKGKRQKVASSETSQCKYTGPCNSHFRRSLEYKIHLKHTHHIKSELQLKVFLDNLTTIPVPSNAPPPAYQHALSPLPERIFREPDPITLDRNFAMSGINTYTSGRINVKYDPVKLLPLVVYQFLDEEYIKFPEFLRPSQSFLKHPEIESKNQLNEKDYNKSGLDRGHLARRRLHIRSWANYRASYFYPYTAPQYPLFNGMGGLWFIMEQEEMSFINRMNVVHSFSGPGLAPFQGCTKKVQGRLVIASFFWKILLGKRNGDGKLELECYAVPHVNTKPVRPITSYFIEWEYLNTLLELDFDLLGNLDWSRVKRYNHRSI